MGKIKRRDWQYKKREPEAKKPVDPGVANAVRLATYQWKKQKEIRDRMAVDKVVNDILSEQKQEVSSQLYNFDFGCAALALHRMYGKDAEECANFLEEMQNITIGLQNEGYNHIEVWDVVRDEIGLDIEVV